MEYNVNVEYDENCEYKGSQVEKTLPIMTDPQDVIISVTSDKPLSTSGNPHLHIGESCLLTVTCRSNDIPVKAGYITIDNFKTKCTLNNEGQANIRYTPLNVGDNNITVRYNDTTGLFNSIETNFYIQADKIPVDITLVNPNTIANLNESVTLNAQVTYDGLPVTYGRVTFLHYLFYSNSTTEDRIEKIIGNPVYLDENGIASITYVPMQSYLEDGEYDEEEYEKPYFEYIRAVYNYNADGEYKDQYGEEVIQWEYFNTNSAIGRIYIKQPNTIMIEGFKEDGNKIELSDYKGYVEAKDGIILKAYINTDDDTSNSEDEVDFTFNEGDTMQVSMHGTVYTTNERDNFADINDTYTATYDAENNVFTTTSIHLAPGYYDFYVTSNVEYGENDNIRKYLQPTEESMHYYLQVDYNQNNNVTLSASQYNYNVNKGESIDITITVNNLTSNQLNALLNKKCYLFGLSSIYESNFIQENNTLQSHFHITFNEIKDYSLYAYTTSITENYEYIPPLYSGNINVFVMGQKELSIELVRYINRYYPGSIEYKASITGIKNDIITGMVYNYTDSNNKGEPIEILSFDAIDNEYNCYIPNLMHSNEYLMPGEYTLELIANNTSKLLEHKYEILQSVLTHEVMLPNKVFGAPQQNANILISASGGDLGAFDIDELDIYIRKNNETNRKECIKTNSTIINDNIVVGFQIGVYTEDTWSIEIEYDDDYYINLANNSSTLETVLLEPEFSILEDADNNIHITITNPQSEYIPLLIELTNNADRMKFIGVTDTSGKVVLTPPEDKTIWNILNNINITTNPTNMDMINGILGENATSSDIRYDDSFEDRIFFGVPQEMITNIDDDQVIIEDVEYIEEDTPQLEDNTDEEIDDIIVDPEEDEFAGLSQDEIIFNRLRNQLINYEGTYLFTLYKGTTKSYDRRALGV